MIEILHFSNLILLFFNFAFVGFGSKLGNALVYFCPLLRVYGREKLLNHAIFPIFDGPVPFLFQKLIVLSVNI